jgi:type II secretion system protein N
LKKRLLRIAKWVAYPAFYFFCLGLFGYLTFPFGQLKTRIIAEFDRMQVKAARRSRSEPMRLEIDELDSYWFSGVEVTGARLIIPPKKKRKSKMAFGGAKKKDAPPPKASVMAVDHITARVQILPLLVGNVRINFDAQAFGGELEGTVPVGDGDVEVEFEGLQLIDVAPLQALLEGIPLQGVASGSISLTPKEGKFAQADGVVAVTIDTLKLGKKRKDENGKVADVVEMQGVELPSVLIGSLNIEASAKDGTLTVDDFGAKGRDFELLGEGKVRLHESWDRSQADVYLKFKFSDAYRSKSDAASSLLGKPGAKFAPAIEVAPGSPFKRAKTDDGFYRFHISGALAKIDFKPASVKRSGSKKPRKTRAGGAPKLPFGTKSRPKIKRPSPKLVDRDKAGEADEGDDDPPEAPVKAATPKAATPKEEAPAEDPKEGDASGER